MPYGLFKVITLPDFIGNIPENLLDNIPVGIILFDKSGNIHFVNKAFHEFEVLYPDVFTNSLVGKNAFSENIISHKSIVNELEELKLGYPFESEIEEISSAGKSNIRLIIKGTPNFENEEFSGGILLIEDLRIIYKTQKEFALRSDFLENATAQLSDGFVVIDKNGVLKFVSGNTSLIFNETDSLSDVTLSSLLENETYEELTKLISQVYNSKEHCNR